MTKKEKDEAKRLAILDLRSMLKPGDEVVTVLRRRSASGMSRCISLYIVRNGQIQAISFLAARALGYRLKEVDGSNAVHVTGCGMDMGFHLVYSLSRVLFPDGFGVEGTKTDNRRMRKTVTFRAKTFAGAAKLRKSGVRFFGRNGDQSGWDNDGGYALKHRWL